MVCPCLPCIGETSPGLGTPDVASPAGNALPAAAQDTVDLLCYKGALLADVQLGIHQDPRSFLC